MRQRASGGKPWCFWGERPGARRTGMAGVIYRRLMLGPLHAHPVPIWGIGQWAVDGYSAEFGHQRDYQRVPYFSNLKRFEGTSEVPEGPRCILYSGALSHRKGVDVLARAFAATMANFPKIQLLVAGDGPLRSRMQTLLGTAISNTTFLGFQQWDELPEIYARACALVAPSRYDGWGLIVPEGLAAGLPVIASTQMGAARDLLTAGKNGWLVEPDNIVDLTSALGSVASASREQLYDWRSEALASVAQHQLADGVGLFLRAARRSVDAGCDLHP